MVEPADLFFSACIIPSVIVVLPVPLDAAAIKILFIFFHLSL